MARRQSSAAAPRKNSTGTGTADASRLRGAESGLADARRHKPAALRVVASGVAAVAEGAKSENALEALLRLNG